MFLSHLLIDTAAYPNRPRPGRSWVRQPYRVHQRLCMAFPSDQGRKDDPHFLVPFKPPDFAQQVHIPRRADAGFLFRIDPLAGRVPSRHGIIVQSTSTLKPDWEYAFHNAPELLIGQRVDPFNPTFTLGQQLRFRLLANPTVKTKRLTQREQEKGKAPLVKPRRLACLNQDAQVAWLERKGQEGGFRLVNNESLQVVPSGIVRAYKSRDPKEIPITLYAVRFEGLLEVAEPNRFLHTVQHGIGSAKGLGFGLLSVAPHRDG